MDNVNVVSSPMSFASSSYLSNGLSYHDISPSGCEGGVGLELLSLSKLSSSLEKLVLSKEYDYTDAEIEVEGVPVGVHRCILAARSPFFHQLFKNGNGNGNGNCEGSKPKYLISNLVHQGRIGYEAFKVVLNYLYTGKVMASPPDVSTCVDESCPHDVCGVAINYAVEMMYASAAFQIKELVMVVKRRLLYYVDKAFAEDVIPIATVAFHFELMELLSHCVHKIVRSDLDHVVIDKELPREVSIEISSLRKHEEEQNSVQVDSLNEKSIRRVHQALDSGDVKLVDMLLNESNISLDSAHALHYAAAYCNPKIVTEVLSLGSADVNLKNSRGHSVLHVAARRKDLLVIVALLEHGASVSDTTGDGQTAVTICQRLTRPKDYLTTTKHGEETNQDKLCINVLEREMVRNSLSGNISVSSMTTVADDLQMKLLLFENRGTDVQLNLLMALLLCENRVAMARSLFPVEAKLAMQIAHAESTLEFAGLSACKGSYGNSIEVDSNEIPSEQIKSLQQRLQVLEKTVETGRRFFPNCSEVLDKLLEDELMEIEDSGALLLEKGSLEEQQKKKRRYMELQDEVMKAFTKDKAEKNMAMAAKASSSSCSSSAKGSGAKRKTRR